MGTIWGTKQARTFDVRAVILQTLDTRVRMPGSQDARLSVFNLPYTRLNLGDLLRKMLKPQSVKESSDLLEVAFLVISLAFGPTQRDDPPRIG
jgi:hypothetical protein